MPYKDKEQQKEYQRLWSKKLRVRSAKFVSRYKLKCGCSRCGYKKSSYALDFHHIDNTTKINNVSKLKTIKEIKKEIRKCVILCANCHRELHADKIGRVV